MAQDKVKALALGTFNAAGLGAAYQSINAPGFANPCFLIRIVNDNTTAITISYDGVNDNEYIKIGGELTIPNQAGNQPSAHFALWPIRTQIYVKGTAGVGTITVSGYYV